MGADVLDAPVADSVSAPSASPEDVTDSQRYVGYTAGFRLTPRAIDSFPSEQRDLAEWLINRAAYADRVDSRYGTRLKRGQVATTYADLADRLGWKTVETARYHLGCLRETWLAVFGQPIELTSGRTKGQATTSRILVITLGGYDATQQSSSYVNDANPRPRTPAKADNRDSREPNPRPNPPASDSSPIYPRPNPRPTPSQLPIDSTNYSNSSPIYPRPNPRPTCGKPIDTTSCEPLTTSKQQFNIKEEEDNGNARTAGEPALKTFSLSKLLEDAETETPEHFYREAKAVYDCAVAGGYIDGEKRPWQMKDSPAEFSPLMNRPHGWRLELLGLLLTASDYYQDKAVNTGQLKHFIGGADLFTAETRRGFARAALAHLLPEAEKPKRSPATAPAENDWRHLERAGTAGGGFKRACCAGEMLAGAASNASSGVTGDPIKAHERANFAALAARYMPGNGSKHTPPLVS